MIDVLEKQFDLATFVAGNRLVDTALIRVETNKSSSPSANTLSSVFSKTLASDTRSFTILTCGPRAHSRREHQAPPCKD